MPFDDLLPTGLTRDRIRARIGLIADTHTPDRRRTLPAALDAIFAGADLLLHAGDVGALWVLDALSAIAPVIAVQGNDDGDDAARELPLRQIVAVAGRRILLWHSHFAHDAEERAARVGDAISVARSVAHARRAGAQIAIFGHWHIPLVKHEGGVLVINPGALAPPNHFARQINQTVARLWLDDAGRTHVVHVDVNAPDAPFDAHLDWAAGFRAADRHTAPIVTPELAAALAYLRPRLTQADLRALRPAVIPLAWPVWDGRIAAITLPQMVNAIATADLDPALRARIHALLDAARLSTT